MSSLKLIDGPFLFYKVVIWFLYCICYFFFRIKIQGREKALKWKKQNKTAFIVIARHRSLWDGALMPVAFGGLKYTMMHYVVKSNLRPFFRWIPFFDKFFTFIDREKIEWGSIKRLTNFLMQGTNIAIFPEGTTIPDYKEMKRGTLLIIKNAEKKLNKQIPISPLNIKIIQGFYGKPKGKWLDYLLRRIKIELRIGGPIFLEELESLVNQNLLRKEKEEEMVKLLLEQTDQI